MSFACQKERGGQLWIRTNPGHTVALVISYNELLMKWNICINTYEIMSNLLQDIKNGNTDLLSSGFRIDL